MEDFTIDRDAITAVYLSQNRAALQAAVERGDWTPRQAHTAHEIFKHSHILQQLVDGDVAQLEASLAGAVH